MSAPGPRLSICIATFQRADFIAETLDSILPQLRDEVELVVVDGNSADATPEILARYATATEQVRYFREATNLGVDRDYDKAVQYARGEWCWLMTDDDLVLPGGIDRVLAVLDDEMDVVVVNARVDTVDFSSTLNPRMCALPGDRHYDRSSREEMFGDLMPLLSFIGSVVVRRRVWQRADRAPYFGSLFIHVGVLMQDAGVASARFLSDPVVAIRYGNAMWSARAFEIWMFKWPALVWSFERFAESARRRVSPREPWRRLRKLGIYRAMGAFSSAECRLWLEPRMTWAEAIASRLIASCPGAVANMLSALYCRTVNRDAVNMYDLARSPHAGATTRWLARTMGVIPPTMQREARARALGSLP